MFGVWEEMVTRSGWLQGHRAYPLAPLYIVKVMEFKPYMGEDNVESQDKALNSFSILN